MLNYHKLKFFSVFLFLIWGMTNAMAGPRDFLQAQQIAQQKAAALGANISSEGIQQAKAKVQEKVTAQRTPPYYIFNFADHAGYVVVSGDDRMPAIVDYSDRGTLNTDRLPENSQEFLGCLQSYRRGCGKSAPSAMKNVTGTDTNQFVNIAVDDFWYQLDVLDLKACATSYIGNKIDVVVPGEITYNGKRYAVTKVNSSCFTTENSSIVKTVKISEGITDLGECNDSEDGSFHAMFYATSLESIEIPKSLVTIGDGCFYACSNLQTINIPNDSHLEIVGRNCFCGCEKLESIAFSKNLKEFRGELWKEVESDGYVTVIGGTFYQCSNLKTVTFDEECPIESFPMDCFYKCINLTSINIPSSMKKVGVDCFQDCIKLESISFPKSLTEFVGKLEEERRSENTFVCYGNTFNGCLNLMSVSFADGCSLEYIPSWCFINCHKLATINIPLSVKKIGNDCFTNCYSLTEIDLPNTVEYLGEDCFLFCTNLTKVKLPTGIGQLPSHCFYECTSLKEINFPNTIREIGDFCFYKCEKWEGEVIIPEGVTIIPYCCFGGCKSLTKIILPDGIQELEAKCFTGCESLNSISIPCTVQKLGTFCLVISKKLKELRVYIEDVPEDFSGYINYGRFKENSDEFAQDDADADVFSKDFLTLYVPASSVEAYKQAVGQYFKEILPLTETGISQPNLDGMTISAKQGSIMISGLKDGTQVRLYAVDGKYIGESIASQGRVSFYCQEPMVIAKVGNKTLKIAVK